MTGGRGRGRSPDVDRGRRQASADRIRAVDRDGHGRRVAFDERILLLHDDERRTFRPAAAHASREARPVFRRLKDAECCRFQFGLRRRIDEREASSRLWRARLGRLWKAYLRLASALAGVIGGVILTVQYFVLLPPFAWLAKRAGKREATGWNAIPPERNESLRRQY